MSIHLIILHSVANSVPSGGGVSSRLGVVYVMNVKYCRHVCPSVHVFSAQVQGRFAGRYTSLFARLRNYTSPDT